MRRFGQQYTGMENVPICSIFRMIVGNRTTSDTVGTNRSGAVGQMTLWARLIHGLG